MSFQVSFFSPFSFSFFFSSNRILIRKSRIIFLCVKKGFKIEKKNIRKSFKKLILQKEFKKNDISKDFFSILQFSFSFRLVRVWCHQFLCYFCCCFLSAKGTTWIFVRIFMLLLFSPYLNLSIIFFGVFLLRNRFFVLFWLE